MRKSEVELTESKVARLKPGEKNLRVWDRACPGFGIEVTPAGSKRWVVVTCLTVAGKQRRQWHTLGSWPMKNVESARLEAANLKDQVKKGEDPKAAISAKREAVRVNEFLDRYYAEILAVDVTREGETLTVIKTGRDATGIPEKGNGKEPVRSLERFLRPVLGDRVVRDIGPAEIGDLLFKISRRTPIQANRLRSQLLSLFAQAERWEIRPAGSNPVRVIKRNTENPSRERRLVEPEIVKLGAAIRANQAHVGPRKAKDPWVEDPYAVAGISLSLLAGMRKGEVLGLRWEWVHLEDKEIRIPPGFHKTGKKVKKERLIRLCGPALAVLERLPRALGNPFVIVGELAGSHLDDLKGPWRRLRVLAGLAVKDEPAEDDATIHDLRRTFGSVGKDLGLGGFVGELLGHAEQSVTDIYTRAAAERLQDAAEAIGGRIAGLLSGEIDLEQEAREADAKRKANKAQA
jgi:integrase